MDDALVSATKYVNAEAVTLFSITFACYIVFFASALTSFVAETSTSSISRCQDIQAYFSREQRTRIDKVSLYQKLHHFLIVLERRLSATPNAATARLPTQAL